MKNVFNWIFLLAPLWFYAGAETPEIFRGQIIFMQSSVLLLIGMLHFNPWVGAFVMLTGAHYFIFDCPLFGAFAVSIGCGAVIYDFVASRYRTDNYRWVIVGILAWTLILGVAQIYHWDILFWQNQEPSGMWTLPSYMGIFAAVTMPVVYSLNPWLALFNLAALVYSKSVFALLGAVFGMMPLFKRSWVFVPLIVGVGFSAIRDQKSGEWERRLNVWPMVLSTSFRSPFFGAGVGNYSQWMILEFRGAKDYFFQVKVKPENEEPTKKEILRIAHEEGARTDRLETIHFKEPYSPFKNMKDVMDELRGQTPNPVHGSVWNHPHNEYLMLFFGWGLIGLWLLWMYVFDLVKRFRFEAQPTEVKGLMGAMVAVLVVSFGHFPFYVPRLAIPIIFLLAILDSKLRRRK